MSGPVGIVKVLKTGGGACCACEDQDGCSCGDTNCGLECQSKAGTGAICGYDEFIPSSPPKKYRTKQTQTDPPDPGSPVDIKGFRTVGPYDDAECSVLPLCGKAVNMSFSGSVPGIPGSFKATGRLDPTSSSGGLTTYTVSGLSTDLSGSSAYLFVDGGVFHGPFSNGDTLVRSDGPDYNVSLTVSYVGFQPVASGCVSIEGCEAKSDVWGAQATYGPITGDCTPDPTFVSNTSARYLGSVPPCDFGTDDPLAPETDQPDWSQGPQSIYSVGAVVTPVGNNAQDIIGGICVPLFDGRSYKTGSIVHEVLIDEDTEQAAITRATAGGTWIVAACDVNTSFITPRTAGEFSFGFRRVRVRATAGDFSHPLVPGHTYTVTITYKWRVLGTSGPYTDYGTDEITFTADAPIETTDWVDAPMEDGKEIRAFNCTVTEAP